MSGWDRDSTGRHKVPRKKRLQVMERHMPGCMYPLPSDGRRDRCPADRFTIGHNPYLGCQSDDLYGALGLQFKPVSRYGEPQADNQDVNQAFKCFARSLHPDKKATRERQLGREMTELERKQYAQAYSVIEKAKEILSDPVLRDQYHYYLRVMHGRIQLEIDLVSNVFNTVQSDILEAELFLWEAKSILALREAARPKGT